MDDYRTRQASHSGIYARNEHPGRIGSWQALSHQPFVRLDP
jgi:hypothetical protein